MAPEHIYEKYFRPKRGKKERKRKEEKELGQKEAVLGVKHMEPGGRQTWVQVLGPQFPSSVTWPYYLISLVLLSFLPITFP